MHDKLKQLEEAIIAAMVEMIDSEGTTPEDTYYLLSKTVPDLCESFDEDWVIDQCERIQQAEIPKESERSQALFEAFNVLYFDGRLPNYAVHVVYHVNFWVNKYFGVDCMNESFLPGWVDRKTRQIFVGYSAFFSIQGALLREMACAATTGDYDSEWSAELRRLEVLGAPLWTGDLEP